MATIKESFFTDVLVNLIKYSNQQLVKNTFLEWLVHEGVVSH